MTSYILYSFVFSIPFPFLLARTAHVAVDCWGALRFAVELLDRTNNGYFQQQKN